MSAGGDFNLNYSSPGPGAGLQISIMLNCELVNWFVLLMSDWFNMGFESYIWEGEVKEGLEGHEKNAYYAQQ